MMPNFPRSKMSRELAEPTQVPTQAATNIPAQTAVIPNKAGGLKNDRKKQIECVNAELDLFISRLMNATAGANGSINALQNSEKELRSLCLRARERFNKEEALLRIQPNILILGDLHGQFRDLQNFFTIMGLPPKKRFLFLGDYVDRGPNSLETISLLLALKLRFPRRLYLLRGNHEARATNILYGFMEECKARYGKEEGQKIWTEFQHVFNVMPIAAVVGERIYCAHGGISQDLFSWKQFNRIVRPCDVPDISIITDVLWSDPCITIPYFTDSPRNVSQVFGEKAVEEFCERMGIDIIVRGHQVNDKGYEIFFNGKVVTIFSAPNYTGMKNMGSVFYVPMSLQCRIYTFGPAK
ncbi:calcineurin-like phosphoesterase domain-containing protein [Ditylenchus destructor]|uniref:Serine/threonine-protein phosphatase n=1 Tax=Ditylenchus destructor TaxID=166010 RepID=A0AAD4NBE9_9BILA|nr:calcineurin-like phosphoesterase domain-containing protein [Ditylenchus destructor]